MKKKFYTYALFTVLGTALLSVIISIIYLIAYMKFDEGESLFTFLGYTKMIFDTIATFAGFATIIYAFSHLDFKDGVYSVGIFFCSFLMFIIYETLAVFYTEGDFSLQAFIATLYLALGKDFISQLVPAIIAGILTCRVTHGNTTREITKAVALKTNTTQRTIFIFSIIMFAINFLTFFFTNEGMFPFLVDSGFYITVSQFKIIMLSLLESFLTTSIIYFVVEYAVLTIACKMYEKFTGFTPAKTNQIKEK